MQSEFNIAASQFLLTFILVVITAYYAYWTRKIVKTTFEIEIMRKKPAIVASVSRSEKTDSVAEVRIENYGLTPAFDVRFEVKDDFYLWPEDGGGKSNHKFSGLMLIDRGMSVMAPGQRISIPVLILGEAASELRSKPYLLVAKYKDSQGNAEETQLYIDFASLPDHTIGSSEEKKIRETLEKIRDEIRALSGKMK